jgi:hypothetical protein
MFRPSKNDQLVVVQSRDSTISLSMANNKPSIASQPLKGRKKGKHASIKECISQICIYPTPLVRPEMTTIRATINVLN